MCNKKEIICPETKLGSLLDKYPQLEDELIAISPSYSKLKNPVLRKTVGKVASLRQVAEVGNISVGELINRLRKKVGIDEEFFGESEKDPKSLKPGWFKMEEITKTLDARPIIQSSGHPLEQVMKELTEMAKGEIYELTTPFYPAPLIDVIKSKGYHVWVDQSNEDEVKNYFCKS